MFGKEFRPLILYTGNGSTGRATCKHLAALSRAGSAIWPCPLCVLRTRGHWAEPDATLEQLPWVVTRKDRSGLQVPHPLGELCVHHEVVNMFLSLGEFQLPGHDSHHECSASCSLCMMGDACQNPNPARHTLLQEALPVSWPLWIGGGGHEKLHRKPGALNTKSCHQATKGGGRC